MSRSSPLLILLVLLIAVGCWRNAPPIVVAPPEPAPVVAPDDGSIPPPREVKVRARMESLALGVEYLLSQQSKDGAWYSDVYATFKDGTALTPLALIALQEAHDAGIRNPALETAIKNGCKFLAAFTKDGTVAPPTDGFDYSIYTASLTLKAFSHATAKDFAKHRDEWVKYLKERQLTEKLGWKPEEKQYGGWGYCRVIPQKPKEGEFAPPLIESNLSATLFALDALRAADALDAETAKVAAIFVRRCQNWPGLQPHESPSMLSRFVDGGFHFIYDDPTRNKAGVANTQPLIFHSYGSTTADGLQALALCNEAADKDRRNDAQNWLLVNFRADHHPGTYVKAHEPNRNAVYYYYAASVAKAFRDHKLGLPSGRDWSAELSFELARRQAKDGSWANPVELVRENDPIVATSNAVLALARCK
jgi:hypothetical protein